MKGKLAFKIFIEGQRSFDYENLERLEDDLARLLSKYGYDGTVFDNLTYNETPFPFHPEDKATPGMVEYKY